MADGGRALACLAIGCALACTLAGCAARRPPELMDRLTIAGEPQIAIPSPPLQGRSKPDRAVRKLLDDPPAPPARPPVETIERRDAGLAQARAALKAHPTADNHRLVAEEYRRVGVLDAAYDEWSEVARLKPRDAAAFDARARIWRDWGFPGAGLADAYRAIHLAPGSPVPYNTLGTLFWSLGDLPAAHQAFERALARDPGAAYAVRNVCLSDRSRKDSAAGDAACLDSTAPSPSTTFNQP